MEKSVGKQSRQEISKDFKGSNPIYTTQPKLRRHRLYLLDLTISLIRPHEFSIESQNQDLMASPDFYKHLLTIVALLFDGITFKI